MSRQQKIVIGFSAIFFLLLALTFAARCQTITTYTGSYTGNATDNRTITVTDLAAAGKSVMVIVKGTAAQHGVWRTSAHTGDASSHFYNVADKANAIQSFSSTGFVVGDDATVNAAATTYYYIAVVADPSYMVCTTYTGTGSQTNITTTIPDIGLAIIKQTGAQTGAWRTSVMGTDSSTVFSGSVFTNLINVFGSNYITIGNGANVNSAAATYYLVYFKNGGFLSVFRYTGNATDNRNISFGKTLISPGFVLISKNAGASANVFTTTDLNSDKTMLVNNTATIYTNMLQNFTTTDLNVGTHTLVNANAVFYWGFALGNFTEAATDGGYPEYSKSSGFKKW